MTVTSRISHGSVKIYIDGILHIHFMQDRFLGLQSWQFEVEPMFYIEITLDGGSITLDYDKREMWVGVLLELERAR